MLENSGIIPPSYHTANSPMATTAIDYYRDTNVMISDDTNRRISQQSIPSLSTTSTDTSTSIDTSRPKSAGPPPRVDHRRTRSPSPTGKSGSGGGGGGGGYLYQTNDFQPWPMYQQQYRGYYSPFFPHMYGVAPQPLINFQDPSLPPMQYKPISSSPKSNKKCYMYEPIMPVPLAAVTMEASAMPEDYDYDDHIPLAYFKRMGSGGGVTNKPHTPKKKGTSPALSSSSSSPTLSSTTEVRPGPINRSRTSNDMKVEHPIRKLERSYTTTTAQQNRPPNPVVKTEKLPKKQRPKPSPPSSPKSKEIISTSNKTSDSGSNSSNSSPKWVSRFQAGMARIRLKSVKSM
ncbi:unnamed protein product [Umbelopsis ramanniana]